MSTSRGFFFIVLISKVEQITTAGQVDETFISTNSTVPSRKPRRKPMASPIAPPNTPTTPWIARHRKPKTQEQQKQTQPTSTVVKSTVKKVSQVVKKTINVIKSKTKALYNQTKAVLNRQIRTHRVHRASTIRGVRKGTSLSRSRSSRSKTKAKPRASTAIKKKATPAKGTVNFLRVSLESIHQNVFWELGLEFHRLCS